MNRHVRILALPLALCLPLMSGCSSTEVEKKTEVPLAKPSTVLDRTSQLTRAAGTTQVSSIVTAPTATTARLVKDGKVAGWSIKDGEKPTQFKITDYTPVATLPLDKLGIESNQAAANKACNGAARVVTAVVASRHALTTVQCDGKSETKSVLIDEQPVLPFKDRFSVDGTTRILGAAKILSPEGPLTLDLGTGNTWSLTMPNIKKDHATTCYYPVITVPLAGTAAAGASPSLCNTEPTDDHRLRRLEPLDLNAITPEGTVRALRQAAKDAGSPIEKCESSQLRKFSGKNVEAFVTCSTGGKSRSASAPINR